MYDNFDQLAMRLVGSFILYEGEVCFVKSVDDGARTLLLTELTTKRTFITPVGDKRLCFKSLPLGYTNQQGQAVYLYRIPERRYKQGITSHSVRSIVHGRGLIDSFLTVSLEQCVKGRYPSFEEARLAVIRNEVQSCAFSKEFAISYGPPDMEGALMHKGDPVGYVKEGKPFLNPNRFFLKEILAERIRDEHH